MSAIVQHRTRRRFHRPALALLTSSALAIAAAGCSNCNRDAAKDKSATGSPLSVAAASDLGPAFKEIGAAYEKETGQEVRLTFGATGLLAKQIAEGAPFEVFFAANPSFVDDVVKAGACLAETKAIYAMGHIVMWSRNDARHKPKTLADLANDDFLKVAIANPEHAPYGRAAKQALMTAGIWRAVTPKLVYGENVQHAFQFAESGNADVAIVARSIVIGGRGDGTAIEIDPSMHDRLDQTLVVCKGAKTSAGKMEPSARRFASYVASNERARAIMTRYGFNESELALAAKSPSSVADARGGKSFGVFCALDADCASGTCFHKRQKERIDAGRESRDAAPGAVEESGYCSLRCNDDKDCPEPPTNGHCGARGMCKRR